MARKSHDNRAAVLELLADHQWHSGPELVEVGGMRAGARVHELRRGEDGGPKRRILCRVVDSESRYRWTCDCGPGEPGQAGVPDCPVCREAWSGEPAPASAAPTLEPASDPVQLGLFAKGAA
jgi:hypothetical protein